MSARFLVGVAVVTVGLLVCGWHGRGVPAEQHAAVQASLAELTTLEHELKQHLLATREGVLNRYDPLVHAEGELVRTVALLRRQLLAGGHAELAAQAEALAEQVGVRGGELESFKSENAILRNSVTYLPAALRGLEPLRELDPSLYAEAERVAAVALSYNASPLPEIATQLREELRRAEAREVSLDDDLRLDRQLFLRHAGRVIEGHELMRPTLGRLLSTEVSDAIAEVATRYHRAHVASEVVARRARGAAAVLVVALLGLLGVLARQLRGLYATLERRVHERTESLLAKTTALEEADREMRRILDNVREGLVSVTVDGELGSEHSATLERWLGPAPASGRFVDWIGASNPRAGEWFDVGWMGLEDGLLPPEVVLDQLPSRVTLGDRVVGVSFTPVWDGETLDRVLVICTDLTAEIEQERLETEQRETLRIFQAWAGDRTGFTQFLEEADDIVAALTPEQSRTVVKRLVHTLKGNAAIYGLERTADCCHQAESLMEDGTPVTDEFVAPILAVWEETRARIEPFLDSGTDLANVTYDDLQNLATAIGANTPRGVLREVVDSWALESAEARLERLAAHTQRIAERLGKDIDVAVDAGGIHLDSEPLASFWSAFVHVLRNAVDHGIESADRREESGKPRRGRVTLSAEVVEGSLRVSVTDDGRGIDWGRIAEKADALGLAHETEDDLVAALFVDGMTSCEEVTETSGRGVGMAVIRAETQALGGWIDVASAPHRGTRFTFVIPDVRCVQAPPLEQWLPERGSATAAP